jgi:hypothetical protein
MCKYLVKRWRGFGVSPDDVRKGRKSAYFVEIPSFLGDEQRTYNANLGVKISVGPLSYGVELHEYLEGWHCRFSSTFLLNLENYSLPTGRIVDSPTSLA